MDIVVLICRLKRLLCSKGILTIMVTYYPHKEELVNVITHLLGLLLSIAATALLIVFASLEGTAWHIVSFSIFGASMIILYLASTLYHSAKRKKIRARLNVLDHAAIYVLIAGTYTPFALVTLNGVMGWVLFGLTWGFAALGIVLKVFYTGRFKLLSTISYVALGWIVVIAIKPLLANLNTGGLIFLASGGIFYTIGAVLFMAKKIKYNHAIFHVLVLLGTWMHFNAVFFFLL